MSVGVVRGGLLAGRAAAVKLHRVIVEREGLAREEQLLEGVDDVAVDFLDMPARGTDRVMVMFVVRTKEIPKLAARRGPARNRTKLRQMREGPIDGCKRELPLAFA